MTFRAGLIVGKFCPLHKGHELLIKAALAACDRVIIISYAKPDFERCDRDTREGWLADLFPTTKRLVIDDAVLAARAAQGEALAFSEVPHDNEPEDVHRRFTAWACHALMGETVDAVFTSEDYGDGFARVLTNHFAEHAGQSAPVTHVCVDKARGTVPISGTKVRSDPYQHRNYLSAAVYRSFVDTIVIYGGESTGKTTLCTALAARLGTRWVPEYGRELWEEKDGELTLPDMLRIGETQVRHEDEHLEDARRWLVCDTSPLTTLFYSDAMFGEVAPGLKTLADRRYDHTFICAPELDFVQDGTRQDAAFRDRGHVWYLCELTARGIPFTLLSGDLEARLRRVLTQIGADTQPLARD